MAVEGEVQRCAASAGGHEAGGVALDLQVLHEMVVPADIHRQPGAGEDLAPLLDKQRVVEARSVGIERMVRAAMVQGAWVGVLNCAWRKLSWATRSVAVSTSMLLSSMITLSSGLPWWGISTVYHLAGIFQRDCGFSRA